MVNELQARLHSLYNGRMSLPQVGPQMCGLERYRIIASGEQLYTLLEAADRIAELEAALRKIREMCHTACNRITQNGADRLAALDRIWKFASMTNPEGGTRG